MQIDSKRIISVRLEGNFSDDSKQIAEAADGDGADMVLDVLGGLTNPEPTIAAINALRPRGTAVFVGGVKTDIPLPYSKIMLHELTIRGSFMYSRDVPGEIYRMISSGIVDLSPIQIHTFPLETINEAIARAAQLKGLEQCIVMP